MIDCNPEHSFESPNAKCCVAYGRDRGDEGQEARVYKCLSEALEAELQVYNYYFDGEGWSVF